MGSKLKPVVVTVGVFDGVHEGHLALLKQARKIADIRDARLVAASFDPHPASILRADDFLGLLTLPSHRAKLLKAAGVDAVEFLEFNDQLRRLTPDEFVDEVLVTQLAADVIVVGTNFRFGNRASGDVEVLQSLASKFGFEVEVVTLKGDSSTWSSTRIRQALLAGEVESARTLLGRPHRLSGEVIYGDQRGRELGFPTANLSVAHGLVIPADGVYSGLLTTKEEVLPAAISIGTNPTFAEVLTRRVEAYVLDRDDLKLYGQIVDLDFLGHIRQMQAFSGIEDLVIAMNSDVSVARGQINDFLEST
ncbi:MAG: bifunctional riboflavin kinase/FAD synthetase [Actinobacteria bacterium]|nr:bifunctional riboflavin kinase/FAD synthetase [Actinomycetota bacterium]NBY15909.1 bifunctional riboflavin kinase/FAD synthetase [Actinomycetota bacterium]